MRLRRRKEKVQHDSNLALATQMRDIAKYEDGFKRMAWYKGAKIIEAHEEEITSGKQALGIEGIGKSIASWIDLELKSGKVRKKKADKTDGGDNDDDGDDASTEQSAKAKGKQEKVLGKRGHSSSTSSTTSVKVSTKALRGTPVSFEIENGEVVWGHAQTVMMGLTQDVFDSAKGPTRLPVGGTILQNSFAYHVAAKPGTWNVSRVECGYDCARLLWHSDEDAELMVKLACSIGIANGQSHQKDKQTKKVVYVNRYDWSCHFGDTAPVAKKLELSKSSSKRRKKGDSEEDDGGSEMVDVADSLSCGRLLFMEKAMGEGFFASVANGVRGGRLAKKWDTSQLLVDDNNVARGVHIRMPDTEYELGWMFYSGEKHSIHGTDELIGFLYDGTYCAMEFGQDEEVTVDGQVVERE